MVSKLSDQRSGEERKGRRMEARKGGRQEGREKKRRRKEAENAPLKPLPHPPRTPPHTLLPLIPIKLHRIRHNPAHLPHQFRLIPHFSRLDLLQDVLQATRTLHGEVVQRGDRTGDAGFEEVRVALGLEGGYEACEGGFAAETEGGGGGVCDRGERKSATASTSCVARSQVRHHSTRGKPKQRTFILPLNPHSPLLLRPLPPPRILPPSRRSPPRRRGGLSLLTLLNRHRRLSFSLSFCIAVAFVWRRGGGEGLGGLALVGSGSGGGEESGGGGVFGDLGG